MVRFDVVRGLITACLICLAAPVSAQEDIALESGAAWTHPHSGIVVPATLTGIERTRAVSFADDFLDTSLVFDDAGQGEFLSIYIFRRTNGSVPVWFEQARRAVTAREALAEAQMVSKPIAFVPPGQSARLRKHRMRSSYGLG